MALKKSMAKPTGMKKLKTVDDSHARDMKYDPRPTVDFTSDELPEIKDWKVGEEYYVLVCVKQERITTKIDDKGKEKHCASFKVVSVKTYDEEKGEGKLDTPAEEKAEK